MATGSDMMMEAVKLVDGIVGELRGFDETPPPKNVWLDIADRLEKAFHEFVGTAASGSGCLDKDFHDVFKRLKNVRWRETMFMDLQTYYAEEGVYVMRCKHGEPNEHYCIIKANDVDEAISRAMFDLHRPLAMLCRNGELSPLPRDFDDYADRIKKAIESEVEPMRKALKEIRDMAVAGVYDGTCDCHEIIRVAEVALGERKEES